MLKHRVICLGVNRPTLQEGSLILSFVQLHPFLFISQRIKLSNICADSSS